MDLPSKIILAVITLIFSKISLSSDYHGGGMNENRVTLNGLVGPIFTMEWCSSCGVFPFPCFHATSKTILFIMRPTRVPLQINLQEQ